jgi:hypothetical protein
MSGIALIKILNVSTMIKKIILSVIIFSLLINTKAGESNLFPEIPGWKMKEDPRVYNSQDLWELIDGAADIFLSYYFEDIHIAEYTNKDQIIRVELYRHRSIEDTYGIYTAERMPDYPQVLIGSQGYKSQGVLNFMAGNYYIKVMSAGVTEADEKTIALVAGKVDAKLAQPVGSAFFLKMERYLYLIIILPRIFWDTAFFTMPFQPAMINRLSFNSSLLS